MVALEWIRKVEIFLFVVLFIQEPAPVLPSQAWVNCKVRIFEYSHACLFPNIFIHDTLDVCINSMLYLRVVFRDQSIIYIKCLFATYQRYFHTGDLSVPVLHRVSAFRNR